MSDRSKKYAKAVNCHDGKLDMIILIPHLSLKLNILLESTTLFGLHVQKYDMWLSDSTASGDSEVCI